MSQIVAKPLFRAGNATNGQFDKLRIDVPGKPDDIKDEGNDVIPSMIIDYQLPMSITGADHP